MTSRFLASAVLVAAAMTSMGASADLLNPYLWEQMKATSTKTRAEVRAEMLGAPPPVDSQADSLAATTAATGRAGAGQVRPAPSAKSQATDLKTGMPQH